MGEVCHALGVGEPEVWAVLTVETRGFGFLQDRRPQILFERHIFHRLTNGRYDADHADICDQKPGGYLGGPDEYTRLERAVNLDRGAALQSASWGIGQVMGFNYEMAGFATVDAMVTAMVSDEDAQLFAVANFIKATHLDDALQRQDWVSFARTYNGSDFKKNEYDTRLAVAHSQYTIGCPDLRLRTAQVALLYLGFDPGPIDGLQGRRTRSALMQFQARYGLPETGEPDHNTETQLTAATFSD